MLLPFRFDSDYKAGLLSTNVIIRYDGLMELVIHALFRSVCNADIEYYPFDEQTCKLIFASWTYDEKEVWPQVQKILAIVVESLLFNYFKMHLILGPADVSEYSENPLFNLENFYADQEEMFNPCCPYPMSSKRIHF